MLARSDVRRRGRRPSSCRLAAICAGALLLGLESQAILGVATEGRFVDLSASVFAEHRRTLQLIVDRGRESTIDGSTPAFENDGPEVDSLPSIPEHTLLLSYGLAQDTSEGVQGAASTAQVGFALADASGVLELGPVDRLRELVRELRRLTPIDGGPAKGRELRMRDTLGDLLLGPVAEHLQQVERVVLLRGDVFADLPFASLNLPRDIDSERRPLGLALETCNQLLGWAWEGSSVSGEVDDVLVVSDPEFRSSNLPLGASLSDAAVTWRYHAAKRREAATAGQLGRSVTLSGQQATLDALLAAAGPYRAVHAAVLVHENPTDPAATWIDLSEGDPNLPARRVTLGELVAGWTAAFELAVFSQASDSLTTSWRFDDVETTGPGSPQALAVSLAALGARSAVVSRWSTGSYANAVLFDHFYSAIAGGSPPSAALRLARSRLASAPVEIQPGTVVDARRPRFWAGQELFGGCLEATVAAPGAQPDGM